MTISRAARQAIRPLALHAEKLGFSSAIRKEHLGARFTAGTVSFLTGSARVSFGVPEVAGAPRDLGTSRPNARGTAVYYHDHAVTERFVTTELGVEQTITVSGARVRHAHRTLQVVLPFWGGLAVRLTQGGQAAGFYTPAGKLAFRYSDFHISDRVSQSVPYRLTAVSGRLLLTISASVGAGRVTIDPLIQTAQLAGGPQEFVSSGWNVAVAGSTLAVSGIDCQVAVYTEPAAGWAALNMGSPTAVLSNHSVDGVNDGCREMESVAIAGDDIIGGDGGACSSSTSCPGEAFVWTEPSGGWQSEVVPTQVIQSPNPIPFQSNPYQDGAFGEGVAASGNEVAISQRGNDYYLYQVSSDGTLGLQSTLTSTAGLGSVVAMQGNTVIASAGTTGVQVWTEPLSGWPASLPNSATIEDPGDAPASFGNTIAIDGNTIVVGDPGDAATDGSGPWVFTATAPGAWSGTITNGVHLGGPGFPNGVWSLAVSGADIAADAANPNSPPGSPGGIAVYVEPTAGWESGVEPAATVQAPGTGAPWDAFGGGVALDRAGNLFIGSINNDGTATNQVGPGPVAWVYRGLPSQVPTLQALASDFMPILNFSSQEKWRPLNVDDFFAENYGSAGIYGPHNQVCSEPLGEDCQPITQASQLSGFPNASDYLEFDNFATSGNESTPDDYHTPDTSCLTGVLLDCNTGAASSMYYTVQGPSPGGYDYIEYWLFYRYNQGYEDIGNHVGDWEGITIAPTTDDNAIAFVELSQHGDWWSYLVSGLRCDGVKQGCSVAGAEGANLNLDVYPASGSHANYPIANDGRKQDGNTNGKAPWGNNLNPSALVSLPTATPQDTDDWTAGPENWTNWPGGWGDTPQSSTPGFTGSPCGPAAESGVAAEGHCGADHGDHYFAPWGGKGVNNKCVSGACPQVAPPPASLGPSTCDDWAGPSVAVTACDNWLLAHDLRTRAFQPDRSTFTVRIQGRAGRAAEAAGLAQLLGQPLRPETRIALQGRIPAGTVVTVETWRRGRTVTEHFVIRGGAHGRVVLRVQRSPGRGLVEMHGPHLH